MKYKKIISLAVVSGLILCGIYAYLGGFNAVSLELVNCQEIELIGLEYQGTPQDEGIGSIFQNVEAERKGSPLYTIYYVEPSGKRDTLHVFVGVEVENSFNNLYDGWVKKTFDCQRAIRASMEMHQLVMPGANSVKQKINDFAKAKGVNPKGHFIDKIISRNKVEVLAPISD
ncbi:hypothetical protein [Cyclobacterium sp.]|uniref:hypothetical protein n=1 Tax=Cyclobacterium sp. TaxID=1966343 RepID=UPI0019BC17B5|nr:hypothetical protein [Cyclobacterium sp.]MBD3630232.1 hypothetical protein [Cyclobacterium sp.]